MSEGRFEIPDRECKPLTRIENMAMEMFMTGLSNLRYARTDLAKRLETVPDGTTRMNDAIDRTASVLTDVCGTINDKQRRHLKSICKDMEVRTVPKMTAKMVSVILSESEAKELVDAARYKCRFCFKENEESIGCELRKILECTVPLEGYGALLCPYSHAEWEEDD